MTVLVSLGDRAEDHLAADRRVMRRDRVLWVVAAVMAAWLGLDAIAVRATERSPTGSVVVGLWISLVPLVATLATVGVTTRRARGVHRLFGVGLFLFCGLWLAGDLVWAIGPPAGLSTDSQRWCADVF